MNSNKVKVAIIGCGRVAGHHARSILELRDQYELLAICDLDKDKALEMAKNLDQNIIVYENYNEMLADHQSIDLVSIVTPSGMHFEHSLDIIENHKKNIVVEKPIVMNLDQGEILKNKSKENNVIIFPVFQYRFNKSVDRVKKAVKNNELGEIFLSTIRTRWCRTQQYYDRDPWRGTFSHDGGACTNQGIHHLDILRYVMGEISKVSSIMSTNGSNIEVEDTAVATLQFESGASGVVEITTAARPEDFESSLSFVGSKGIAVIGGWATNELVTFSPDKTEEKRNSEIFPDVYGFGHKVIYEGIYKAMKHNDQPYVSFEDAMKTIKFLHAIYVSSETNDWCHLSKNMQSSRLGELNDNISKLYQTPKKK
tara:strand:- start:3553 stop:4656 length:1104 start_codon:yes stop_codon:yes gene_type:complete